MSIRLSQGPGGVLSPDPDGTLVAPLDSELAHRYRLRGGVVVDVYLGMDDDEVRAWDATHDDLSTPEDHQRAEQAAEPEAAPAKD